MPTSEVTVVRTQRRSLSRERVVDAAVAIADEHGIDAVTLRRLAEALGVHATSIYNHLESKDAILDALAARMTEEANLPLQCESWQTWVRTYAACVRDLAIRHPGGFAVFTRRAVQGSVGAAQLEAALDAFRRGGFSAEQTRYAVPGVGLAIMGLALNEAPAGPAAALPQIDAAHYPRTAEALAAGPPDRGTDRMWELLVESLITGLEAQLVTGGGSRSAR